MNKDKIFEYIKSFGLIIKKIVDHKNGDTTIRFGKKDIVKDSSKLDQVLDLLTRYIQEFKEYKVETNKRFDTIDQRLTNVEDDIKDIKTDVKILKEDIAAMKNAPTMKKELKLVQ